MCTSVLVVVMNVHGILVNDEVLMFIYEACSYYPRE